MKSWTENFGKFYTNSFDCDTRKEIFIGYDDNTTGEDMVIMAIQLAKRYNCKIVGRVEYTPGLIGGKVSFVVECHSLSYRYFYGYGKTYSLRNPEVQECDLQKYEKQFQTRKCIHKGYKKQFWFTDNWSGRTLYFPSLRKAKAAASKQTGNICYIYETFPYGRNSQMVCRAPASGFTPP